MKDVLKNKSYQFAIRIINMYKYLNRDKNEYVISKQLLRCGTAIGALIREAEYGQSKADFIAKMSIALKEANETDYWLSLLKDTGYLNDEHFKSIKADAEELLKLLISTVKTSKNSLKSK